MKVFVYGTLMKNRSNHDYHLGQSEFLGSALLKDFGLYDLGPYPGIKPQSGTVVLGELYEISEETKSALDRLEGEGYLYLADKVTVWQDQEQIDDVLVYVYSRDVDPESLVSLQAQPWICQAGWDC